MLRDTRKSKPEYTLDNARKSPNSNAARAIRFGFHCPKIITASARNPKPATPFSNFYSETPAVMYTIPPSPPRNPEIRTPM